MKKYLVLLLSASLFALCAEATPLNKIYQPTHDSVATHPLPEWYQDAKFGVIIHYGIYSVPGWAPIYNPVGKVFTEEFFKNNPYPEWYSNTMQIKASPTYQYHLKKYGADFKYDSFAPLFNNELKKWTPDAWTHLFAQGGIKYVVLVSKHHDGFLLWPSKYRNPYKPDFIASRDVIKELTTSVRKHPGMHMALYYSGGYDWSWPETNKPITDIASALERVPQSSAYSDYVFNQWKELIDRYHPDLLWNDIALPSLVNKWQLFADYYNEVPEGVVNNRWGQGDTIDFSFLGQPADALIDLQLKKDWFDYYSPEYIPTYKLTRHKWEADHGLGYAFAYNQEEYLHPEHLKTLDQLIEDLADLVSKNGNLLLGIGPKADGTIPDYQSNILIGIGKWLKINGDAIYATRSWKIAESSASFIPSTKDTIPVRFTQSKNGKYLFIILLKNPHHQTIVIDNIDVTLKKLTVLTAHHPQPVKGYITNNKLTVYLDKASGIPREHALVLRIEKD
jgi:alpha-L-fucosidase